MEREAEPEKYLYQKVWNTFEQSLCAQLNGLWALPSLQGKDHERVRAANQLYFLTLCISYIAFCRKFLVSVENPSNAYFWLAMQTLTDQFPMLADAWFSCESTHFQSCAHGGERDKWTCWFGTQQVFTSLRAVCTHVHSAFQVGMASVPGFQWTVQSFQQKLKQLIQSCYVKG